MCVGGWGWGGEVYGGGVLIDCQGGGNVWGRGFDRLSGSGKCTWEGFDRLSGEVGSVCVLGVGGGKGKCVGEGF